MELFEIFIESVRHVGVILVHHDCCPHFVDHFLGLLHVFLVRGSQCRAQRDQPCGGGDDGQEFAAARVGGGGGGGCCGWCESGGDGGGGFGLDGCE